MTYTQEQLDAIKRASGGALPSGLADLVAREKATDAATLIGQTVQKPSATTARPTGTTTARAVSGYTVPSGVNDVAALQRDLNSKGASLVVDGVYGPKTAAAYSQYGVAKVAAPVATATNATSASTPAPKANPYVDLGYKPKEYKSKYYDEAMALIKDAQDDVYDPASYDPEKDARFTTFRDKAIETGQRGYSANLGTMNRNGLASSSVAQQIAQGAMDAQAVAVKNAIPEFQAQDRELFYDARDQKLKDAERLLNLDAADYARFVDEENRNIKAQDRYQDDTGYLALNPGAKTADQTAADARALITTTRSSGGSGTSKAKATTTKINTNDISTMGTEPQVSQFYRLLDGYTGGGSGIWKDNAAGAYAMIQQQRGTIEKAIGTPLYNQLLKEVKGLDSVAGAPKTTAPKTYTYEGASAILNKIVVPQKDSKGRVTGVIGVDSALARIDEMVDNGEISEQTADRLIADNPYLSAYINRGTATINSQQAAQTKIDAGRAYSQTRFED